MREVPIALHCQAVTVSDVLTSETRIKTHDGGFFLRQSIPFKQLRRGIIPSAAY
ncbi:MAG: hypothetical protein JXR86_12055 [Spirochaetales bacterium]|nr:hypothetical protein [Spirochaetales bacterium]